MSVTPPAQDEPPTDAKLRTGAWRGPSLTAYVGVAVCLLGIAVLLWVAGVVDDRIAPLWNPGILAAVAIGVLYAEPRPPLWQLACAGAVLGLAYAGLVLGADALTALQLDLGPADVVWRALCIGIGPPLAGGLMLHWFAPASRAGRAE
jgi:hypothetical protein